MRLENLLKTGKRILQAGFLASSLFYYGCTQCGTSPQIPEENQEEVERPESTIETKIGETDVNGQVIFTDNSTLEDVVLNIVDKQDNSPVPSMNITYWDGEGFEVFLVDDPSGEYLPSLGIYPHNSTHTIEVGKFEEGIYEITRVDEENSLSKVIWSWKSESGVGKFSTYSYERTVDYDEYIEIKDRHAAVLDLVWKGIESFWGKSLPIAPSQIVELIAPEEENPPQRWDIYTYRDGYNATSIFTMIPSNIPEVEITALNVDGNEVSVSWEGSDKDTYDQLVFLPDNRDLTKYLDGNSTSDLVYSHRVIDSETGSVYGDHDWTPYNSDISKTINIPNNGSYSLELRVKDEVDNIGYSFASFSVGDPNFRTMTDSRDDQVYDIVKIGDQWWMAENLRYNGGRSSYYNNDSSNSEYGRLYRGWDNSLCPEGWSIPSNSEWSELIDYLGGTSIAGGKMKSTGTIEEGNGLWYAPNTGATNEIGFNALPAGNYTFVDYFPRFSHMGNRTVFWSSTMAPDFQGYTMAYGRELKYDRESVSGSNSSWSFGIGCSIRCIKD